MNPVDAPSNGPSDPVALTVKVEGALDVMTTAQPNVPDTFATTAQLVIDAPAPMVVVIVDPGVNPLPMTVTGVPLGPRFGLSAMIGCVTQKVVAARSTPSKLPSDALALTV